MLIYKEKVLLLIVGKGNENMPDYPASYLRLIKKSIDETCAGNIVLFPSGASKKNAEPILKDYEKKYQIRIEDLPGKNTEFDADQCYEFFEGQFRELFKKGFRPENIIIDFTHGTKAMSAALYAIGMRYRVSDFHYIKRNNDKDGNLTEGETIQNFDASYARGLAILDQCKTLFKTWQFSAASTLISSEKPSKKLKITFDRIKMLADFYAAWDRLDYKAAASNKLDFEIPGFDFAVDQAVRDWIDALAKPIMEPEKHKTKKDKSSFKALAKPIMEPDEECAEVLTQDQLNENARIAIDIMFDLYANGLRRLEAGQFEDAAIRAYRMAEMLGQIFLFQSGYISDHMSSSDPTVSAFAENNRLRPKNRDIYPPFGRKQVIKFLEHIKHPNADFLRSIDGRVESIRNESILIHGFSPRIEDAKEQEDLRKIFDTLLYQLKNLSGDEWQNKKDTALFMNNFKDKTNA